MTWKLIIHEQEGKTGYIVPATESDQRDYYWKYTGRVDEIKTALQGFENVEQIRPTKGYSEDVIVETERSPQDHKQQLKWIGESLRWTFGEIWYTKLVEE